MRVENEYKPIEARAEVGDLTLPELVREHASLKVDGALLYLATSREHHARLGEVVDELRRRGALD